MARTFNGSSDKASAGTASALAITGTLTVAVWFRLSAYVSNTAYVLLGKSYNGTNVGYKLGFNADANGNHLAFITFTGGAVHGARTSATFSSADVGTWHHACATFDGSNWHVYVDGVEDTVAIGTQIAPASTTSPFYVGAEDSNGTPASFFPGDLAEAAVWNVALSLPEILSLAKGTRAGRVRRGSQVAYWPLFGLQSPEPEQSGAANSASLTLTGTSAAGTGPRVSYYSGVDGTAPYNPSTPATAITLTGPSSGYAGAPSANFTVGANGTITGTVVVTPSDSGAGGTFTPSSVSISSGTPTQTFTYTPALTRNTPVTISETNNGGLTNATPLTYTVSLPTISLSPNQLAQSLTGATVTVTGVGSRWLTNTPTFTYTGVSCTITGQSVVNNTSATLTVTTGALNDSGTITETAQGETATLVIGTVTRAAVVQFGPANTGLAGTVGYTLFLSDGSTYAARSTSGVSEIPASSGNYVVSLTLPWNFAGGIVWDNGSTPAAYAAEDLNLGGTPLTASETADAVASALDDVGLTTTVTGRIDVAISTRLATASYTAPLSAAGTRSAVGLASANLDTQLSTIAGYVDTEVAAIKAKTDNLPSAPAAVGSAMTLTSGERDSIAAAVLDLAAGVETGLTVRQFARLVAAVLLGKSSNSGATFRDTTDSKNRITSTVDASGNRTSVTRDAT